MFITKKIVVIGGPHAGKTLLSKRWMEEGTLNYDPNIDYNYEPTLGVEILPAKVPPLHKFNLWDCAGDKQGQGGIGKHFVGANGALVIIDTNDALSFIEGEKFKKMYEISRPGTPIHILKIGEEGDYNHVNDVPKEMLIQWFP